MILYATFESSEVYNGFKQRRRKVEYAKIKGSIKGADLKYPDLSFIICYIQYRQTE